MRNAILLVVGLAMAAPAYAQLGRILDEGAKRTKQYQDLKWTDAEEQELGAGVSARVREKYGVVQNEAVHRYVALVGTLVTQKSPRPTLPWRFIVLDTHGVNAFAAPGGYIHITRGALALIESEAELADVLGHEIVHVTERHTIKALQKNAGTAIAAEEVQKGGKLMDALIGQATELVLAGYGRNEELEADARGIALANAAGYAPTGLGGFLTRLSERNKASTEKQGLFASHPEMKERLDRLSGIITQQKLTATATLEDRYNVHIDYQATPLAEITVVAEGTAGLAGGGTKKDQPATSGEPKKEGGADQKAEEPKKKRGFGLPRLLKADGAEEKKSAEVIGSGGSRGVDRERNAKGGSNPTLVAVKLTADDIAAFKKEGKL